MFLTAICLKLEIVTTFAMVVRNAHKFGKWRTEFESLRHCLCITFSFKPIKIKPSYYSSNKIYEVPISPYSLITLPIPSCDKAKYLGVFIDSHLNFNSHVESVESKVARSMVILGKSKHFLLLLFLNYTMLESILICGMIYPFGVLPTNLTYQSHKHFQNKAVKIIGDGKYIYGPCYTILF